MAVAIVRSLTLAQVQAAIDAGSTSWNNNYAGTQIYVTDKGWTLQCYLDRECKPLSGVLKINNGDTLPAWLTPETLLIDTGTITAGDYSVVTGTPIDITTIAGYALHAAWAEGEIGVTYVIYNNNDNQVLSADTIYPSSYAIKSTYDNGIGSRYYIDVITTEISNFILEFKKSYV